MAARILRKQEVADAVKRLCEVRKDLTPSSNEKGFTLMPGDILVSCSAEGKLECNNPEVHDKLVEILMDMPTSSPNLPQKSEGRANVPATPRSGQIRPNGNGHVGLTVDDIKSHFCPLATDQEAYTFLQVCLTAKANPWLGEAYLIKYDEKSAAKTVMGKYFFLKKAEAHPQYGGFSSGIIVQNSEGKIEERVGKFKLPDEKLLGGWAEVTRKDRTVPKKVTVSLSEYSKENKQWRTMGATMIEKVAIVQGHRDMFPGDMGGLYDAAEVVETDCIVVE